MCNNETRSILLLRHPSTPFASAQTHPQGGIPSTSMQLQFCNVAFLIAAYYKSKGEPFA
jgi:hypothetical protein